MLLRRDHEGMNAWKIAAFEVELHEMKNRWGMAKERLTTEEIKKKCYFVETMRE